MKIRVRFFASFRELVGHSQLELELASSTTVSQLRELINRRFPSLENASGRVAVNTQFAEPGQVLQEGDEVALLPPLSGG